MFKSRVVFGTRAEANRDQEIQTQLETPVVLIIFNRPTQTGQVLEAISRTRPKVLLVIGDGPRQHIVGEADKVSECRELLERIDWPCQVLTNFSEINLGCRDRVSSGLSWVFSKVEEAIILEDDCLPSEDFFKFTSELLVRFRDDERIGSISGSISPGKATDDSFSYFFSAFPNIWGWATWARVWKHYSDSIPNWPQILDSKLLNGALQTKRGRAFWKAALNSVHSGKVDTWDYQFSLVHWSKKLLSIVPNRNLVTNIGFGPEATHTVDRNSKYSNLLLEPLESELRHPASITRDYRRDFNIESVKFAKPHFLIFLENVFNSLPASMKSWVRKIF
jgi:hypothetical protein